MPPEPFVITADRLLEEWDELEYDHSEEIPKVSENTLVCDVSTILIIISHGLGASVKFECLKQVNEFTQWGFYES